MRMRIAAIGLGMLLVIGLANSGRTDDESSKQTLDLLASWTATPQEDTTTADL